MNTKRSNTTRYVTITTNSQGGVVTHKEDMVPVLFHDPNNSEEEPQYAYATFSTEGDSNEVTVTTLTPEQQQQLLSQAVVENSELIDLDYNATQVRVNQPKLIRLNTQIQSNLIHQTPTHVQSQSQSQPQYQSNPNVIIEELIEGEEETLNEEQTLEGKELIIDENGQTFTIHHLVTENGSPLTEVETLDEVEEEEGQTILHIVPAGEEEDVEEAEMCIDESGNVVRVITTEEVLEGLTTEVDEADIVDHHHQQQQHGSIITVNETSGTMTTEDVLCVLRGDLSQGNEDSLGVSTLGCSTGLEDNEDEEEFEINEITLADPNQSNSNNANKSYYCPNCGNCYSAAGSLKLHMRACMRKKAEVPEDDRRCNICKKIFNSVSYLKVHMLRHNGSGPKRCSRCYRKFPDEEKWKQHMEQHTQQDKLEAEAEALTAQHGGSKKIVVKEFTCSFCSQNFTVVFESGQVKRRYACDPCREKYSNAEMLKQHKQMVEEKREFHCERCGRKFVFEGFLQRHLPTCDGTIKRRRDAK